MVTQHIAADGPGGPGYARRHMSPVSVAPAGAVEVVRPGPSPLRPAAVVVGAIALVAGLASGALLAWWAGLAVTLVVAGALWMAMIAPRLRTAEERALRLVGPARPADPRGDARLLNLVEGLSPGAGLTRPRVLVIDDEAPNALVLGRDARRACVVATTGLGSALTRMQLEAVVAHLLVQVRDGLTAAPTLSLAFRPARAPAAVRWAAADAAAVTLTRFPPGLIGALRVLGVAGPAAPAGADAVLAPLWIAPPGDATGLAERIDTLEGL